MEAKRPSAKMRSFHLHLNLRYVLRQGKHQHFFFSPLLCSLRCLPFFSLPNRNSRTRAGSLWPIDFSIGCMYTVSRCTLSCVCLSGSGHSQTRKSFSRSYTEMDVSSFSRFCLCSHREILPAQNRGSLLFRRFSTTQTLKGTGPPPHAHAQKFAAIALKADIS